VDDAADRTLEMVPVRLVHVETWKRIAVLLARSERWCRTMAERAQDPLPVFRVGGIVRLLTADLDAWLGRQRAAALRPILNQTFAVEEHW
jgi:hypothetical protein